MLQTRVISYPFQFFGNNLFHIGFYLIVVAFYFRLHRIVAVPIAEIQNFRDFLICLCFGGKNGKNDPLKTAENDHLKLCLIKSKKLSVGNGV